MDSDHDMQERPHHFNLRFNRRMPFSVGTTVVSFIHCVEYYTH